MHSHTPHPKTKIWNNASLCVIHCSFSKHWSWPTKGIQFPWNMTNSSWFAWDFLDFSTVSAMSQKPPPPPPFSVLGKARWVVALPSCLYCIICLQLPFLALMSFQAIAWRLGLSSASSLWHFLTLPDAGNCSFLSAPIEHLVSLLRNLLHFPLGCFFTLDKGSLWQKVRFLFIPVFFLPNTVLGT